MNLETHKALKKQLEDNLPATLAALKQLVQANSHTQNIPGVIRQAELTADLFIPLGFTAEHVPDPSGKYAPHLYLIKAGQGPAPSIALVSHLDTVFTETEEKAENFSWREEGTRIYGPGVIDIKGGTMMIHLVLKTLQTCCPQLFQSITWKIFINSSEEVLNHAFAEVCLTRLDSSNLACLVFEADENPEQPGGLVTQRKGRAIFKITATGKAAHAGAAYHTGASAIVQLAEAIQRIDAINRPEQALTVNIGYTQGGTQFNRVAHEATAFVDMRAFEQSVLDSGVAQMMTLNGLSTVRSQDGEFNCSIQVELLQQDPAWPRTQESDTLLKIWNKMGGTIGIPVDQQPRGGISDGNFLASHYPTLDGLGPCGSNAHASEYSPKADKYPEYLTPQSYLPKALLNILAIEELVSSKR